MIELRVEAKLPPASDAGESDYEERAAILEFDANMTRPEAERKAREMLALQRGETWGSRLVLRLPCGHEVEVIEGFHVAKDGRVKDRLQCPTCRVTYDEVRLMGYGA